MCETCGCIPCDCNQEESQPENEPLSLSAIGIGDHHPEEREANRILQNAGLHPLTLERFAAA